MNRSTSPSAADDPADGNLHMTRTIRFGKRALRIVFGAAVILAIIFLVRPKDRTLSQIAAPVARWSPGDSIEWMSEGAIMLMRDDMEPDKGRLERLDIG